VGPGPQPENADRMFEQLLSPQVPCAKFPQ
jgi:hypothetical protein